MKVAIAQLNPTVGDLEGNYSKLLYAVEESSKKGADIVAFPELFLQGYAPNDLLHRPAFIDKIREIITRIVDLSTKFPDMGILVGTALPNFSIDGNGLYNAAILICNGKILNRQPKTLLSAHDVFYEARYFDSATDVYTTYFKNEKLGISVCQDIWNDPVYFRRFKIDPLDILVKKGATLFINLSASPFHKGKEKIRYKLLQNHSRRRLVPFVYVNMVGGNGELVFDGRSMCMDRNGNPIAVLPSFQETVQVVDMSKPGDPSIYQPQDEIEAVYEALILGIRDFKQKCGFNKAVVGLSGGIDSSLTCVLAAQALGRENTIAIGLPSAKDSIEGFEDAKKLTENLGVPFKMKPITPVFEEYRKLFGYFGEKDFGEGSITHLEARVRSNILMSYYSRFKHLILSTGNKTELALGYFTLYGDNGGLLGVLSDVPKSMIYQLANYINRDKEIIPWEIFDKTPSYQSKLEKSLGRAIPSYQEFDRVIYHYLECGRPKEELLAKGFKKETVDWVVDTMDKFWHLRTQLPPGLKVTNRSFGSGIRVPLAAKYTL